MCKEMAAEGLNGVLLIPNWTIFIFHFLIVRILARQFGRLRILKTIRLSCNWELRH